MEDGQLLLRHCYALGADIVNSQEHTETWVPIRFPGGLGTLLAGLAAMLVDHTCVSLIFMLYSRDY